MTSSTQPDDQNSAQPKSDFSIDHILNRAGNMLIKQKCDQNPPFPWLQCTRYCPPKLPRSQKKDGPQKRQLGRHPRIPFSSQQLSVLEEKFRQSPYLSSSEVTHLSQLLQLADIRVKIWFQNRRARERRERTEQETQRSEPKGEVSPPPLLVQLQSMDPRDVGDTYILSAGLQQRTYKKLDFRSAACFADGS